MPSPRPQLPRPAPSSAHPSRPRPLGPDRPRPRRRPLWAAPLPQFRKHFSPRPSEAPDCTTPRKRGGWRSLLHQKHLQSKLSSATFVRTCANLSYSGRSVRVLLAEPGVPWIPRSPGLFPPYSPVMLWSRRGCLVRARPGPLNTAWGVGSGRLGVVGLASFPVLVPCWVRGHPETLDSGSLSRPSPPPSPRRPGAYPPRGRVACSEVRGPGRRRGDMLAWGSPELFTPR